MNDSRLPRLALALAALTASGCDEASQAARCADMEEWLEGRASSLGHECRTDDDCAVVWVRPDAPIAANPYVADAAARRVLAEFERQCGDLSAPTARVQAVCIERVIQVVDPGDYTRTIDQNLGQSCVLRGWHPAEGSGEGSEEGSGAECLCDADADCGDDTICVGCSCVPDGPCAQACAAAAGCGLLAGLGLGTDGAACQQSCASAGAALEPFAACLRARDCDAMSGCTRELP